MLLRELGSPWRRLWQYFIIRMLPCPDIVWVLTWDWMDRTSKETLKYLLDSIWGARVPMIFTYRPEFVPTWGSRSYHSQVTLTHALGSRLQSTPVK